MQVDLNADLGEAAGFDRDLMTLITSANICCGEHAGSREETARTLRLAAEHSITVGAHPGYPDREHFGRRDQNYPRGQLIALLGIQLQEFQVLATQASVTVRYVKPHGALYNQACRDRDLADSLIAAIAPFQLPVMGLPGSQVEMACMGRLPFVPEGFVDRRYREDGSLVPRTEANALIHDVDEAVQQAEQLVRKGMVRSLCIHGDNPAAVNFARAVRQSLLQKGIVLSAFRP